MTTNANAYPLTDDAAQVTDRYVRAMNAGDAEAVLRFYTEDAVSVWDPVHPVNGQEHRDAVTEFMKRKPVMSAQVRESYGTSDTALLVVDWTIDLPGEEQLSGTGLDVLRRGTDGNWRYAVDNPFGDN